MIKLTEILNETRSRGLGKMSMDLPSNGKPERPSHWIQFTTEEAAPILDKYIGIMHKAMSIALAAAKKSGYTGLSKLFIDDDFGIRPGDGTGRSRYVNASNVSEYKKYPPVFPGNSPIMFTDTYLVGINIQEHGELELRGINLMSKHIPGKKAKMSQTIKKVNTLDKLESELKKWVPMLVSDAKAYAKVLSVPPEDTMSAHDQVRRMYAKQK
jgi:hypothetical protein